jgi:nicotinamidase-related amidase
VIVDVQDKLCTAMESQALQAVVKNCGILLQAARLLEIPTIYTEQVSAKLGATLPELLSWLSPATRVEKASFSCCAASAFCALLADVRPQVVLAGMEAHICIVQTALQLQQMGRQVFVAEDAVISRNPANKDNALQRLRQAGVIVSNTESIVYEWLKVAEGDVFKKIAKLIR